MNSGPVNARPMSARARKWVLGLAAADGLAWILTVHSHFTYHHTVGGPTIMPVGQLLGWVVSILLLIVIALIVLAARQNARYERRPPRYRQPNYPGQ